MLASGEVTQGQAVAESGAGGRFQPAQFEKLGFINAIGFVVVNPKIHQCLLRVSRITGEFKL
jgi:hypothetical protein